MAAATKQIDLNVDINLNLTSLTCPHTDTQNHLHRFPSTTVYTRKSRLLLSSASRYCSRALVSYSRTWCFPCTHTQTRAHRLAVSGIKPWTFRVTVHVNAHGHDAAPCRTTVRHIIKDEADDRMVYMKET